MTGATKEQILRWDMEHVWHPYTQMSTYLEADPPPLVIDRAEGVFLYDVAGRRYFDANSSWWVNNLGHGHPRVRAAIHEQLDQLAHCSLAGCTHEPAAALAHELVEATPEGLNHVFYSDDGSTAVEVALKAAFQYWQQNGAPERNKFISFQGAFHGETVGCVSIGGVELFHRMYQPLLFDVLFAPSPAQDEPSETPWHVAALDSVATFLAQQGDRVAGIVVEPLVQGAMGMRMYSPEILSRLAHLAREADTFLIADEVFVGMGRTGTMWACEQADVSPDFLCSSKGLAGGFLPFAATLTTDRVFDGFLGAPDSGRTFYYGHSYTGNPLGAAAARAVLATFRDDDVLGHVAEMMPVMAAGLKRLEGLLPVMSVRQTGLIGALDLCPDEGQGYLDDSGWRVYRAALKLGAYLRPLGNVVYFLPSLLIEKAELEELLQIAYEAVKSLE